jgi:undecaprenyl-diphosphatase
MQALYNADRRLYLLIHSRFRAALLDMPMIWLTKAGTKGVLWFGLAAGMLVDGSTRGRWVAILSIGALLLAEGLINFVLKPAVRRQRPYEHPGLAALLVGAPGPHSWPSAHAGSSIAAAAVLAVAYPLWGIIFVLTALLIGYSRVYVGVHYPFDVAAGILVGIVAAAIVLVIASILFPGLPAPRV